jgi:hypothetical protein
LDIVNTKKINFIQFNKKSIIQFYKRQVLVQ